MSTPNFARPSEALEHFMQRRGITAYQLSKETLLTQSRISEILANKRRVTTEAATILGSYFENGADYWLGLQVQDDVTKSDLGNSHRFESIGELAIGGYAIRCYVLPDESRVVSATHFLMFFGFNSARTGPSKIASLIDSPYLRSAKIDAVRKKLTNPIKVADEKGSITPCYEGELIVDFCQAILDVRRLPDALPAWAQQYAAKAEIIVTSIAKTGIAALIDEATGFQARRHRSALQELLDAYFMKETYGRWTKRFPDWFYEEIFRLNGWKWASITDTKRPPLVGKITKDIVYSRLEPGVIQELESRNPLLADGKRKVKHHQWLSEEIGHPALDRHFYALRGLFRASKNWKSFMHSLRLSHPRKNEIVQLELDDYAESI